MKPAATDRQIRAMRDAIAVLVEPVGVPTETCPECGDGYVQVPDPHCHHRAGCGCGGDEVEVDCSVCRNLRVRVCDDGACELRIEGLPMPASLRIGTGRYCRDCAPRAMRTEEAYAATRIAEAFPSLFAAADLAPPRQQPARLRAQPA